MEISTILSDKDLKVKQKTEAISQLLLDGKIKIGDLLAQAKTGKDSDKATCIEALEFATKINPLCADASCLTFVSLSLKEKAPRIKWESAKVVGNVAHLFPENLDEAVVNLLENAEHSGTVVRWSAAFALGEILKSGYSGRLELIPALETICEREEKNSIKKIYQAALKKVSR